MDNIILVLGDKSKEIGKTLETHYKESIRVLGGFRTPTELYEEYYNNRLRTTRIIISDNSFKMNSIDELSKLMDLLDRFNVSFEQCYFLVHNDEDVKNNMSFFVQAIEERNPIVASKIRVFEHEKYSPQVVINYCLDKIPRKHFVDNKTEFDEVIRVRKGAEDTFKLEEDAEESDKAELVVIESEAVTTRTLRDKLKNIYSLANLNENQTWENNKIIKDIYRIDRVMKVANEIDKFEIDYTSFELSKKLRNTKDNIIIVTGEGRSGKSTMAYAIAKSSAIKNKTLLIDMDIENLGLSFITETLRDNASAMLLQDFKEDFKNALTTLTDTNSMLNIIVSNTKTIPALSEIDYLNLINLLIMTAKKYFDNVIVDLPIKYAEKAIPLFKNAEKVIITIPNKISNLYSTLNALGNNEVSKLFDSDRTIIIPTSIYKHVKNLDNINFKYMREVADNFFDSRIPVMPDIEVRSLELDDSLIRAIKAI